MTLNDPPINLPDPDSIPDIQKSSWAAKRPGRPAAPTDVYVETSTEPVERVRMVKRTLKGVEYLLAADGSGRVFRPRPGGRHGAVELSQDELNTLLAVEPDEDED